MYLWSAQKHAGTASYNPQTCTALQQGISDSLHLVKVKDSHTRSRA